MPNANILALAVGLGLLTTTSVLAQSRDFDLSDFDRVDIATGLDARITQGEAFAVTASSRSQDALDNLQITVDGSTLTARLDQNFLDFIFSGGLVGMLLSSGNAVTIDITVPTLSGVAASSGADIDFNAFTTGEIALEASSGADISGSDGVFGRVSIQSSSGADVEVSGTADNVELEASSGAGIDAENLVAATAVASASSGANVSLHASESIRAEASSGGHIDVHGDPATRDVDESSGGGVSFED